MLHYTLHPFGTLHSGETRADVVRAALSSLPRPLGCMEEVTLHREDGEKLVCKHLGGGHHSVKQYRPREEISWASWACIVRLSVV